MKTIYHPAYRMLITELRRSRESAGLTQTQAGLRVGKSRTWVHKIEAGELRLDVLHFVLLCNAVGCDPGLLLAKLEQAMALE